MMNESNAFEYREGATGGGGGGGARVAGPGPDMGQYKFSPEELRVLGDCNRESFWQRSMPLGVMLGLGTLAGVQAGKLRPNPRFGAFPKVAAAVAVGYFVGKLSYQNACAEKLMALPNSYIGQLLRDRRDGKIEGGRTALGGGAGARGGGAGMLGAAPGDVYSDAGPGSALDLDTSRPAFTDDTYQPGNDRPPSAAEPAPAPARSYDDLRRQNRGEFNTNKQDPYRVDGPLGPTPPPPRRARPASPPTNQYGDALD